MRLPVLPVRTVTDATLDLQRVQRRWNEFDGSVATAYRNAEQKIPSGASTRVKLDKAISDVGGHFDLVNGWYITPAAGYYIVFGQVQLELAKGFTTVFVSVSSNERLRGRQDNQTALAIWGGEVGGIVPCVEADTIELFVYHEAGVEEKLEIRESCNRLSVARVA